MNKNYPPYDKDARHDTVTTTRRELRMYHVVDDSECTVGVARKIDDEYDERSSINEGTMSINNAVVGSSLATTSSLPVSSNLTTFERWIKKLNKKHLFGILLLIIVDIIWVASAVLTQYLFEQEHYDQPLFTVYFKTILFIIYLLPFVFWRPWQRLCCFGLPKRKKKDHVVSSANSGSTVGTNETAVNGHLPVTNGHTRYGTMESISADSNPLIQRAAGDILSLNNADCISSSSFNASAVSPNDTDDSISTDRQTLGPSSFTPTKFNDGNRFDSNSESLPRQSTESTKNYLTSSSSTPLGRSRRSNVRFCHAVEVKSVPSSPDLEGSSDDESDSDSTPPTPVPLVPVKIVAVLALIFGILWFFANYFYAKALETQSVAAVNTLSSLSGVFVLVLAAIPIPRISDKDKFSLTKLVLIAISVGGAVLIGLSPSSDKDKGISTGVLFALGGSCLYALYLVLLSKFLPHPDSLEVPMFFGFVGLTDGLLLIPIVLSWHFLGIEKFELPPTNMAWTVLLINGFIGTVLSELLWLWSVRLV